MDDAFRRLMGAVLIRAIQDWLDEHHHQDAQEFLSDTNYTAMVGFLGIQPLALRRQIETGDFDTKKLHAAYRRRKQLS